MKEMHCTDSLFGIPRYSDEAAVVTTNGVIRKNGCGVMGAGQALEAKRRSWASTSRDTGTGYSTWGSIC